MQNDASDYRQDHARKDSDTLETVTPATNHNPLDLGTLAPDSPTSQSDAGLDDAALEDIRSARQLADGADEDLTPEDLEDENLDGDLPSNPREITMTDLNDGLDLEDESVRTPEMSDFNVPGEVDIEELNDDALDDTDLPLDARLDPIEE